MFYPQQIYNKEYIYLMRLAILLLIIFFVQIQSEYFAFGQQAVNAIFKDKKDTLILFTSPADSAASAQFVEASASDQEHVFTTVDKQQNKDHFNRFAEYLGIEVETTPTLIYLVDARKKYVGDASDLSSENLASFISKVKAGQVKPFLKSAPIPTGQTGAVKTIVGNNFKPEVLQSDKQVLLKIYAPWCGHCKTIAPHFDAAAQAIANNSNVILANFDGTLNEADGIEISGYPTLYWYAKDKTVPPVTFNGQRDKDGILAFIKDHTQYEWVEPKVAEGEEL